MPIQFEFEITREEYTEAWRVYARGAGDPLKGLRRVGVGAAAVGFFLLAVGRGREAAASIVVIGLGVYLICFSVLKTSAMLHRLWGNYMQEMGVMSWEIDEDALRFTSPHVSSVYRWSAFQGWSESPSLYYLRTRMGKVVLIPKRAMNAATHRAFRELVTERMQTPVRGAFPVRVLPPTASPPERTS